MVACWTAGSSVSRWPDMAARRRPLAVPAVVVAEEEEVDPADVVAHDLALRCVAGLAARAAAPTLAPARQVAIRRSADPSSRAVQCAVTVATESEAGPRHWAQPRLAAAVAPKHRKNVPSC